MGHRFSYLLSAVILTMPAAAFADFTEGFDTGLPATVTGQGPPGVTLNLSSGPWFVINKSIPLGVSGVFQGNPAVFPAHQGATNSYAGMNFQSAGNPPPSNQSVWFMTPEQTLNNGDTFRFFTRGPTTSTFPDRLRVRMSTAGASTDTGPGTNDVGVFSTLLLSVNEALLPTPAGYPFVWTQFTATVSGLGGPTQGRIAFNYNVPNGGPSGLNGDFIGIDTIVYTQVPEPSAALASLAFGGLLAIRRRRRGA